MPSEEIRELFWKLYKKIPQELQDALFAEETGNNIYDICQRNGAEESLGIIVDYVGQVLVGILPPKDFQKILEKELKLNKDLVEKIAQEINRFIFSPVKESLATLYEIGPAEAVSGVVEETGLSSESKPKERKGPDIYREPIE